MNNQFKNNYCSAFCSCLKECLSSFLIYFNLNLLTLQLSFVTILCFLTVLPKYELPVFYVFMVRNWFKTIVLNSIFVGVPALERTEENIKDFFSQGKSKKSLERKFSVGLRKAIVCTRKPGLTEIQREGCFSLFLKKYFFGF